MKHTETRKVGTAGEWYVYDAIASAFDPKKEIEAIDFLDSNGIDLAFYANLPYLGRKKYGISVKSRNTVTESNSSLNLHPNDLLKCRQACAYRGLEPVFAFCVMGKDSIDLMVITLDALITKSRSLYPKSRWTSPDYTDSSELLSSAENRSKALPIKIRPAERQSWVTQFGDSEGLLLIQRYERKTPHRYLHEQ